MRFPHNKHLTHIISLLLILLSAASLYSCQKIDVSLIYGVWSTEIHREPNLIVDMTADLEFCEDGVLIYHFYGDTQLDNSYETFAVKGNIITLNPEKDDNSHVDFKITRLTKDRMEWVFVGKENLSGWDDRNSFRRK